MSVITATWEAEAEESQFPGQSRLLSKFKASLENMLSKENVKKAKGYSSVVGNSTSMQDEALGSSPSTSRNLLFKSP